MRIIVKTLGKFTITATEATGGKTNAVLDDDALRSDTLRKLFVYMLCHRDHLLTVSEIAENMWRDDETDNPAGALKNLMYRLRTVLKNTFGEADYIITGRGSYRWNPDIEVELDAEIFDECCRRAKNAENEQQTCQYLEKAVGLYDGLFMEKDQDVQWIVTVASFYHSAYMTAVKKLAESYLKSGNYAEAEELSNTGLKFDNLDEQLYIFYIRSLIGQNKSDLAMKTYENARKTLYEALGVSKTPGLTAVYEEMLQSTPDSEAENPLDLGESIKEKDKPVGAFFCGYPVFREIYRLDARKIGRMGEAEYMVVLTLKVPSLVAEDKAAKFLLNNAMNHMAEALSNCLRIGDVASKCSESQYAILLPACSYESAIMVCNRVLEDFRKRSKSGKVVVEADYQPVTEHGI